MRDGLLDVRVVLAARRFGRLRAMLGLLPETSPRPALVRQWTAHTLMIESKRGPIAAALDGELVEPSDSWNIDKHPHGVRLFVPDGGGGE